MEAIVPNLWVPVSTLAPETTALEVHPPKKQKGKRVAKEKKVIQIYLEASSTFERKSEINVLAKDFPYPEFMDKELMTPTLLEQLRGDDSGLVEKFQWAGYMLLKSAMLLRYSDPVISSGIQAIQEVKDFEERINLLEKEKLASEKANK